MQSKIVLVAGASGGIGSAIAERLAREGWTVLVHGSTAQSTVPVVTRLTSAGLDAHAVPCSLADAEETERITRDVLSLWHHIDALVYCAGVSWTGLLTDMTEADWQHVMDVNLTGCFRLCRAFIPEMVSRGHGNILTISSMWGRSGASCEAAYSASKAGLIALTRSLAKELGPSGVRCNCIAPGVIDTRMMAEHSEETKLMLAEDTPLMRLGSPKDIAGAAAFLLSEEASFITGQVLGIDGGYL